MMSHDSAFINKNRLIINVTSSSDDVMNVCCLIAAAQPFLSIGVSVGKAIAMWAGSYLYINWKLILKLDELLSLLAMLCTLSWIF